MSRPPHPTRRAWLRGSVGVAAACAAPWAPPAGARSAAALALPPLPLRERRLANGLHVIALPEPGGGTVAVQLWYFVGSKHDPPGRSGFAHLFEHMMFKRTKHLADEQFDRLTEDVGGVNNAFTADDVTVYQSEVPANHLERILWAEAERMAHLDVSQAAFDSERAVVQEEYRERIEASPYGRLMHALPTLAYERHPYRRPGIGNLEELAAATLADVRAFHAAHYRPDNAALIVAGDVDPAALDRAVDRYFGPLARPAAPVPGIDASEPRRTQGRRTTLRAPNVPLPAVALLWQGPAAAHADAPALGVAQALLAGGESSRLHEALVLRGRGAQAAGFSAELNADAGMLVAYAIAAGEARAADPAAALGRLERALLRELGRLADTPPSAAELDKVRAQLLTAELTQRETPPGRAEAAGWALVMRGDAREADRDLARLQAVGAADVQRVLRQWLLRRPRVTVEYLQGAA